jgi:hypothetical protein
LRRQEAIPLQIALILNTAIAPLFNDINADATPLIEMSKVVGEELRDNF